MMSGIGMGDKYSWNNPPTYLKEVGEYDYMSNAKDYLPLSISSIEQHMNETLDDLYSIISDSNLMFYGSPALVNTKNYWNSLFLIEGEEQQVLDYEKITDIYDDAEGSFRELRKTVDTYLDDAKDSIKKINNELSKLQSNAEKIANAKKSKDDEDNIISGAAREYLSRVEKYGKEYTVSDLSSIGKWVY